MHLTDEPLIERSSRGDQDAFSDLVERYRDMVYGLGYHLTGHFEDARDLAQEVFVQAFLKLGQLREAAKFPAWLRQIALNTHRMRARVKVVPTVPLEVAEMSCPDGLLQPQESGIESVVREALARLREPERLALTLQYINGYSQAEIGAFLGVSAVTVKARIARARQHLKEEMMQMVEDVFDQNALPKEFREDVIKAVNDLVTGLRSALPENLLELRQRQRRERNQKWREILARMPEDLLPRPLKVQGEAPQIAVTDLPEGLREEVRDAICRTWLDWTFGTVGNVLPWAADPDNTWVQFYQRAGSPKWYVRLANVPGNCGTIFAGIGLDPEDAAEKQKPLSTPDDLETVARCPMDDEVREAYLRLRRAVPGASGTLRGALYAGMADLMQQARQQLPADVLGTMKERSVSMRELAEPVRDLLRRAFAMHWGSHVIEQVEPVPECLRHFDDAKIEFGLYSGSDDPAWIYGGTEYVTIHDLMQTGIAKQFDDDNRAITPKK